MTPKSKEKLADIESDLAESFEAFRLAEGAYMAGTPASSKIAANQFANRIDAYVNTYHQQQLERAVREARIDELERTSGDIGDYPEDYGKDEKWHERQRNQFIISKRIAELQSTKEDKSNE